MTASDAVSAPVKSTPLWEDFIDVLTSPARVFERRRSSGFAAPMFIVAVLVAIINAASLPLMAPMRDRQMAMQADQMRQRGMNDEQIASARNIGEKFTPIATVVGSLVIIPIAVAIVAAVTMGVGRLFDVPLSFRQSGVIATYSMVPTLISMLLGAALLAVLDAETLPMIQQPTLAPVMFLGRDTSPVVAAIATRFGLGEIWSLAITAIGVSVIGRVPRGRGYLVSAILWVLGTGVAVLIGLRAAAMMAG